MNQKKMLQLTSHLFVRSLPINPKIYKRNFMYDCLLFPFMLIFFDLLESGEKNRP